jgi:uncharacterized repeat protein (TIGR01451 family)
MPVNITAPRRLLACAASLSLILTASSGALATPEDDVRRIEELRECIDRTDALRGQDSAWREAHCPDTIEAAKAQLEQLVEEQKERVRQATAKSKKKAEKAAAAEEEEEEATSADKTRKAGTSQKGATAGASSPLAGPGLTLPAEDQALPTPQIPRDPCAAAAGAGFAAPPAADLGFGALPPVNPELITWGVQQTDAVCGQLFGLLGGLPQLPDLPSFQAELQTPGPLDVDKQVNQSDLVQPFGPGEQFFYDIFIMNNTDANASGTMSDDVPDELTINSVSSPGATTCTHDTDIVSCTITDLPAGETDFVTVVVTVPEDYCEGDTQFQTAITNTATTFQQDVPTGTDSVLSYIICAPLNVEKLALYEGDFLQGGDTFLYQITITNEGPATLEGGLDDSIPAPPFEIAGGPTTFGSIDCDLAVPNYLFCGYELDESETATVFVPMEIPEDFCDPRGVQNTVQAYINFEGQLILADRDAIFTEVQCADVAIEKSADDTGYSTGEIVTYTIGIFNFGPATAHDVEVTDFHPPGFQFLSATTTHGSCSDEGDHVLCTLGDLLWEDEATIEIRYRITGATECPAEVENIAEVSASNDSPTHAKSASAPQVSSQTELGGDGKSNSSSVTVSVTCAPNIVITKTAELSEDGRTVTYTITALNNGTEEATGVVVNDDLDDALTDVQASTTGAGPCVLGSGNTVSCDVGTIPVDGSETVTITAGVPVGVCPARNQAAGAAENEARGARSDNTDSAGVGGDCVLGTELTRDGVLGLALTGFGLAPLALLGGMLLLSGAALRRMSGGRRRRP